MNKNMWIVAVVVVLVLLGGGYFLLNKNADNTKMAQENSAVKNDQTAKPTDSSISNKNTSGSDSAIPGPLVTMSKQGGYEMASSGMSLYVFDKDSKDVSNCTGQCLVNWPPYLVTDALPATMPEHLGTFTRSDGSKQFTWNGLPLYFFKGDKNVGDITGDGVGGTWHLAK